jgi:hypothetical protein
MEFSFADMVRRGIPIVSPIDQRLCSHLKWSRIRPLAVQRKFAFLAFIFKNMAQIVPSQIGGMSTLPYWIRYIIFNLGN